VLAATTLAGLHQVAAAVGAVPRQLARMAQAQQVGQVVLVMTFRRLLRAQQIVVVAAVAAAVRQVAPRQVAAVLEVQQQRARQGRSIRVAAVAVDHNQAAPLERAATAARASFM
jgi:hypothetical protein